MIFIPKIVSAPTIITIPTLTVPQIIDQRQEEKYENESIEVIKSISSIIKDVLNKEKDTKAKSDFDNIVQKIQNKVPTDVKIKTPQIDNSELQKKITETVGNILTDDEIESIVLLRNVTALNGKTRPRDEEKSITTSPSTTGREEEDFQISVTVETVTEVFEIESTAATEQNVQGDEFMRETTIKATVGEALLPNLSIVRNTSDKNTAINQSYEVSSKGIRNVNYICDLQSNIF